MKQIDIWPKIGLCVLLAIAGVDHAAAQGLHTTTKGAPGLTVGATVGLRGAPGDNGAAAGGGVVRIRHMTKIGRASVVQRTPEYTTTASRTARKPREWAVFDVPYDTLPEWIDELVFTFSVLSQHRTVEGKTEYSFYQTTVRYTDIARGEHLGCAVLSPAALLRYGDPVALAVEIAAPDGTLLTSDTSVMPAANLPPELQKDWWKNPKVTDNANVVKRAGYLMDRAKSPFAFVNVDDYEAVK